MKKGTHEWHKHVKAWQGSGLSQAEYCRRNDIGPNTFNWWVRKNALQGDEVITPSTANAIVAVPVKVVMAALPAIAPPLRLHVGKVSIEVEKGFCPQSLRQVLDVLGA